MLASVVPWLATPLALIFSTPLMNVRAAGQLICAPGAPRGRPARTGQLKGTPPHASAATALLVRLVYWPGKSVLRSSAAVSEGGMPEIDSASGVAAADRRSAAVPMENVVFRPRPMVCRSGVI